MTQTLLHSKEADVMTSVDTPSFLQAELNKTPVENIRIRENKSVFFISLKLRTQSCDKVFSGNCLWRSITEQKSSF